MTSPRERLKHINTLRAMVDSYQDRKQRELDRPKLCDQSLEARGRYNLLVDRHCALRWALGYVGRHVDLETGHLTIPLDEPVEAA